MSAVKQQMSEEQAVNLVRNALLVAGEEMGDAGEHWPVINSTVHSIMRDFENLKIERNVTAEMKKHYGDILNQMDKDLALCPTDMRPGAIQMIKDLRELYDARFSAISSEMVVVCDADIPIHVKRAENIIKTLEAIND